MIVEKEKGRPLLNYRKNASIQFHTTYDKNMLPMSKACRLREGEKGGWGGGGGLGMVTGLSEKGDKY